MILTIDTKQNTRMTCTPSCELSCGLSGGTRQVSMRSPTVPNQSKERADVKAMAPSSHRKLAWAVIKTEQVKHAEENYLRRQKPICRSNQASTR